MSQKCYIVNENTLCFAINAEEGRYEVIATLQPAAYSPSYLAPKTGVFEIGDFDMIRIAMMDDFKAFSSNPHGITDTDTQQTLIDLLPKGRNLLGLMSSKLADLETKMLEGPALQEQISTTSKAIEEQSNLVASYNARVIQMSDLLKERHQTLVAAFESYKTAPSPALLLDLMSAQTAFQQTSSRCVHMRESAREMTQNIAELSAKLSALCNEDEERVKQTMKLAYDLRLCQQVETPVCL